MKGAIDPLRRRPGSGFVLIYTLWILAAASIVLAVIAKSASQPARVGARQFEAAIELPETVNVLDYVLAHSTAQEREIDPRFITYRAQSQREVAKDRRSLIRELKEIVGQFGMELDVPDDGQTGIEVITDEEETREEVATQAVKVRQGRLFGASKEVKTIRLGEARYRVQLQPGNARPNLNVLALAPLTRYLIHLGLAADAAARLAAVVHDWVDADDFLSDEGAESGQYPFQHGPRNAPIPTWDEVFYLKGANAQLVEFLREHFTLHGGASRVHAGYLDSEALAAITDLEPWQVVVALENHELAREEQVPLGELIGDEEASRFHVLVDWESDNRILLVEVSGAHAKVSAVFDTNDQQLLDWYLGR